MTPVTSSLSVTALLISPTGNVIGTATSPSPGAPAVLTGVQSSKGGTYKISVSGGTGEYTITPTLNAFIDPAAFGGNSDSSIGTAQPVDPYANAFVGNDSRTRRFRGDHRVERDFRRRSGCRGSVRYRGVG